MTGNLLSSGDRENLNTETRALVCEIDVNWVYKRASIANGYLSADIIAEMKLKIW